MKQAQLDALVRRAQGKPVVYAQVSRAPRLTPEGRPYTSEARLTSEAYRFGFGVWAKQEYAK